MGSPTRARCKAPNPECISQSLTHLPNELSSDAPFRDSAGSLTSLSHEWFSRRVIFSATARLMNWLRERPSRCAKSFASRRIVNGSRSGKQPGRLFSLFIELLTSQHHLSLTSPGLLQPHRPNLNSAICSIEASLEPLVKPVAKTALIKPHVWKIQRVTQSLRAETTTIAILK